MPQIDLDRAAGNSIRERRSEFIMVSEHDHRMDSHCTSDRRGRTQSKPAYPPSACNAGRDDILAAEQSLMPERVAHQISNATQNPRTHSPICIN